MLRSCSTAPARPGRGRRGGGRWQARHAGGRGRGPRSARRAAGRAVPSVIGVALDQDAGELHALALAARQHGVGPVGEGEGLGLAERLFGQRRASAAPDRRSRWASRPSMATCRPVKSKATLECCGSTARRFASSRLFQRRIGLPSSSTSPLPEACRRPGRPAACSCRRR